MSLQVWLPFTDGTLKQQGLKNVEAVIGGNISLNDNGKLGKCATISASGGGITLPASSMTSFTECTVAFWIKINSWNTSYATFFQAGLNSAAWNNYIFGILRNNTGSNLCFTLTNSNGTSSSATYTTSNLNTAQWYHLAFTYKAETICIYIDGVLDKTYSTTYVPNFAGITNISIGRGTNNSSYQTNCNLNDFRLYDHCLSSMEVKELAKGLVLHYPLDDKYIESTTNLITTEDCLSATCFNGATNKYGYGTNTDIYKTITTFDGRKGTKVYMGTNGNNCYPYVYVNSMYTSNGTNSPEYKTLSFDYYTTISTSISPYKLGSGSGTATYKVIANGLERTGTGTNSVVIPIIPNTWNHVEVTFHGTTDADAQWGYIQNQPTHVSNTNNFWFFANMQLETKDHATAYAGVGGTRNSNIVYDCSGFCNNGTTVGTFAISNDTPKYSVSTTATGGASTYLVGPILLAEAKTAALWIKCAKSQNAAIFNDKTSGLQIGLLNSLLYMNSLASTAGFTTTHWKDNEWNHVVVVNDSGSRKAYVNGQAETQSGANNYYVHNADNCWLWNRSYNNNYPFYGSLSDLRVYATALSANDVKSLYQNSAYIDSSGNVYGAVHTEV